MGADATPVAGEQGAAEQVRPDGEAIEPPLVPFGPGAGERRLVGNSGSWNGSVIGLALRQVGTTCRERYQKWRAPVQTEMRSLRELPDRGRGVRPGSRTERMQRVPAIFRAAARRRSPPPAKRALCEVGGTPARRRYTIAHSGSQPSGLYIRRYARDSWSELKMRARKEYCWRCAWHLRNPWRA